MTRIGLALILTVAGCGSQVELTANAITGSVLQSGIYTGEIVCEGTFTDEFGTFPIEVTSEAGQRVISATGLPIESGLEAREGNTLEREFGGIAITVVIDAVTVTSNGVVVDSTGSAVSNVCTLTECTAFEMVARESYKVSGQDSIELKSFVTMLITIDGQTTSGSVTCTGTLGL